MICRVPECVMFHSAYQVKKREIHELSIRVGAQSTKFTAD